MKKLSMVLLAGVILACQTPAYAEKSGESLYYFVQTANDNGLYTRPVSLNTKEVRLNSDLVHGPIFSVGDWLYYMQVDTLTWRVGDVINGSLYRVKADGSERTKLTDDIITSLAVTNEAIFYTGYSYQDKDRPIMKMNLDGTGKQKISTDLSYGLQYSNGWIYYSNYSDQTRLYKMKPDGSQKTKLTDDILGNIGETGIFEVLNDVVFFAGTTPDKSSLTQYLIYPDGSKFNLPDSSSVLQRSEHYLYYTAQEGQWSQDAPSYLFQLDLTTKETKKLAFVPINATFIKTDDDNILYRTSAGEMVWLLKAGNVDSSYSTSFIPSGLKVRLNNKLMSFSQSPMIINNRTFLPMREVFEALGATISWVGQTSTVTAVKDGRTISLTIGSTTATVDGQQVNLDVPAQIINNRTMVPIRFVSESLGSFIDWEPNTQTVYIIRYK